MSFASLGWLYGIAFVGVVALVLRAEVRRATADEPVRPHPLVLVASVVALAVAVARPLLLAA